MDNIYKVIWGDVKGTGHKLKMVQYVSSNAGSVNEILSAYRKGKRLLGADMDNAKGFNSDFCALSAKQLNRLQKYYPQHDFYKHLDETDWYGDGWEDIQEAKFEVLAKKRNTLSLQIFWGHYFYFWKLIAQVGNPNLEISDAYTLSRLDLGGFYVAGLKDNEGPGNDLIEFGPNPACPATEEMEASKDLPVILVFFGNYGGFGNTDFFGSPVLLEYSVAIRSNLSKEEIYLAFAAGAATVGVNIEELFSEFNENPKRGGMRVEDFGKLKVLLNDEEPYPIVNETKGIRNTSYEPEYGYVQITPSQYFTLWRATAIHGNPKLIISVIDDPTPVVDIGGYGALWRP